MSTTQSPQRLSKKLGLFDVYAIATGAMFSSGFFLLPGLAVAQTGGSAFLAYLAAGVLILPAMLSVAELSTAMPRAGGAYYFLDRAMGPLMGTIGGLGSWVALVLKSAFALIGLGAYLAVYVDVPIKPLAVSLTLVFAVVNVLGAKETAGLQRILVGALVGILGWYMAEGLLWMLEDPHARLTYSRMQPFVTKGIDGFFATIGLVFVSYAGLTKVASVAEEIREPDRNIPRGMILALVTATSIYALGVMLMELALPRADLMRDLTPVSTAGAVFFDGIGVEMGAWFIVAAAIAAFASTGNAGVMSAARYPLAMARDQLVPARFARLSRFGTPTAGIVVTAVAMIVCIVTLDIAAVAKLASAFQLALFGALCAAVIVMRESRIDYYRPGFRSPLYPWVQIAGILIPIWLIVEMGWLAVLFTGGVVVACIAWYLLYARRRVAREGAIFHVFARLGERSHLGLDAELRLILAERGLHTSDRFEAVVSRARVVELDSVVDIDAALAAGAGALADSLGLDRVVLARTFAAESRLGLMPVAGGVALPHLRTDRVDSPRMALVRLKQGLDFEGSPVPEPTKVFALVMLISPDAHPGRHLRILARLAERIDRDDFLPAWREAPDAAALKELLLRDDRFLVLDLDEEGPTAALVGRRVIDAPLPAGVFVSLVRRDNRSFVPRPAHPLLAGDRITLIGEPEALGAVRAEMLGEAPDDAAESS